MSERLRVLFHVDCLSLGGLEKSVTNLALSLDPCRFDPIVSYAWRWGLYGTELQSAGIRVEQIVPGAPGRTEEADAIQKIRSLEPAIFHTFSCRRNAWDVAAARAAGVPVILSSRSNTRYWSPQGPALNWEFDRNAMTDVVVACCNTAARIATAIEGIHPDKMVVIHNGVEIPEVVPEDSLRRELGIPSGAFLAGYAASYRPLKAHANLLRAWVDVIRTQPDAFLICCGTDDEGLRNNLQDLASRLGLTDRVMLLEARQDMNSFYRSLNLYLHASSSEGFSLAILEAMSHGLPVLAGAIGGNAEAIEDGLSGVLTSLEPRTLAAMTTQLASVPEVRRELGRVARERIREKFSLSRMTREYEELYVRTAEGKVACELRPPAIPQLTGNSTAPSLDDTTVFIATIGDVVNFEDCIAHLEAQTVRCRIELIDRVAPMSAAFTQMHERCRTPYYVQVDEDMLLYPEALATLHDLIHTSDARVPMVCAPLWDCDTERPILGVKIYRHEIVKRFPYRNTISCDITQLQSMENAGHPSLILSCEENSAQCLGEHGKHYNPRTIFLRWQRLFHKRNEIGRLHWLDPWPARLLERYIKTGDQTHLYAALGAIAGVAGRADANRELDWRDTNPAFQRMLRYFPISGEA